MFNDALGFPDCVPMMHSEYPTVLTNADRKIICCFNRLPGRNVNSFGLCQSSGSQRFGRSSSHRKNHELEMVSISFFLRSYFSDC